MIEQTFDATIACFPQASMFVDGWLESLGCGMKIQMQIDLALDELFTNIASYAYGPEGGKATLQLDFDETTGVASVTFIDSGIPYDPLAKPDPDVTLSAEERGIGGLGIYMAKKAVDKMEYRYENNQNILTVYKKIKEV
jgi:anti-sigma regulatory factor (Ser/Thr protein kinase)